MTKSNADKISDSIIAQYIDKSKKSLELHEQAKSYLPGGDTRSATHFNPYPLYMKYGEGFHIYDIDGNKYLDLLNNYSSLVHGHAHPKVIEKTRTQLERGTVFGAPSELQLLHARHLCERMPALELMRYCNSGTEATMFAMRAARAFTGCDKVIKIDGGYHGTHDFAEVSVHASAEVAYMSESRLNSRGVPGCVLDEVLVAPFNELDAVEEILMQHPSKVAAIIAEPMLGAGGVVPAKAGYLQGLRELADNYGVLLIFDEVITFRIHQGGMQGLTGVRADLTALGKIIGGGLAIGAFGGRREIMEQFDPDHKEVISHSGTFNGNHTTMAAGLATMELYDQPEVERLNQQGMKLRDGITKAFGNQGIRGQATGVGSVVGVHWTDREIVNAGDVVRGQKKAGDLPKLLHLELINRGIFSSSRGLYILSTPMDSKEVEFAVETFEEVLELLKPVVADKTPHLLI